MNIFDYQKGEKGKKGKGYTGYIMGLYGRDDARKHWKTRDRASALCLRLQPKSPESMGMVAAVAGKVWSSSTRQRIRPTKVFLKATGAILGGLLVAAWADPKRFSYRSMRKDSFVEEPVGYRAVKAVIDGLLSLGLIDLVPGTGGGTEVGVATRLRATAKLLRLAQDHGVASYEPHFESLPRPATINEPLVLKASSRWTYGEKMAGRSLSFNPAHPKPTQLGRQVNEINAFMAPVSITPDASHHVFRRVFNQGDLPSFDWNKGGRLISLGKSYQQMPQTERKGLRINGEPIVEIDLRASHLTILHALLGAAFDPLKDPYKVPDLPREIVKAWVTMVLGYDRFQTRWSKANKDKYNENTGGNLQKDYPVEQVQAKVLQHLPILKDWPTCHIRWGDLQYVESCAVIDAVHELATKHGVPALPVHDSIIVPASKAKIAHSVLSASFQRGTGVVPSLCSK